MIAQNAKLVRKFVLTGGPCAGKSTVLVAIRDHFEKLGWCVVIVAETATELLSSGVSPSDKYPNATFQYGLLRLQLAKEAEVDRFATLSKHEKVLVIFDRGVLDGQAYCTADDWGYATGALELDLHNRYDGVIHLRTVADGKPELYRELYKSNPVRVEDTPEKALQTDRFTEGAWLPYGPVFVGNDSNMAEKSRRVIAAISQKLGIPAPLEIERKFLVFKPENGIISVLKGRRIAFATKSICQYYLPGSDYGAETRIRSITTGDVVWFVLTTKNGAGQVRQEKEEFISRETFESLLRVHPNMKCVKKQRVCFVYDNLVFEVDELSAEYGITFGSHYLCEVELLSEGLEVRFPHWLVVGFEVTGEKEFSNFFLAM